ncbi:hypothetical protein [Azospirillum oryzae]|uniref:hypothetical protein n=1 Tax=Azospirillum oryzae TaxID=286727 RepID=UPI0011F03296|nr:hypothetical protein [Azospirillum oryzae]GLR81416.1 hypothetical protein GCM10007856_41020 [Azospirillum oryzae]
MVEVGQRFVLHAGRKTVWEVVGVTTTPDGLRHVQMVSVEPPGERKTLAETELERGRSFRHLG